MTLPAEIYSPEQISELSMELKSYIDARATRNVQQRAGADIPPPAMSPDLRMLYERALDNMETPETLLSQLESLMKKAPVVHLIFAAQPGAELKKQLTLWFRTEIHPEMLITYTVRRDVGGGVMMRAGSSIYDFTFRRKILDNKHRLTELA